MADKFELELITNAEIVADNLFWHKFPLMHEILLRAKKVPIIAHIDVDADTLGTSLAEIAGPTNDANFTTPTELFLDSTSADDSSLEFTIIGQKGDESIVEETITTAAVGTTEKSAGDWLKVWTCFPKNPGVDTLAGDITLQIAGGGTVYFTYDDATKAVPTGSFHVPVGKKAAIFAGMASLGDVPASAQNGVYLKAGESFEALLTTNSGTLPMGEYSHIKAANAKIAYSGKYKTGMTAAEIHTYIVCW